MRRWLLLPFLSLFLAPSLLVAQAPAKERVTPQSKQLVFDYLKGVEDMRRSPKTGAKLVLDAVYERTILVPDLADSTMAFVPLTQGIVNLKDRYPLGYSIESDTSKWFASPVEGSEAQNCYLQKVLVPLTLTTIEVRQLRKDSTIFDSISGQSLTLPYSWTDTLEISRELKLEFHLGLKFFNDQLRDHKIRAVSRFKEEPVFPPLPEKEAWWIALDTVWRNELAKQAKIPTYPDTYYIDWAGSVKELRFRGRGLTHVPNLAFLTRLHTLDLSLNPKINIDSVGTAPNLRTLELEGCSLSSAQPLAHLTALDTLRIPANPIKDLSPLSTLVLLKELDVRGNEIDTLAGLEGMRELVHLNVGENKIRSLEPIRGLENLTKLHIQKNQVESLEPLQGTKPVLIIFNAFNNPFASIDAISTSPKLTHLDIGYTGVTNIIPLLKIDYLFHLNLTGCAIDEFGPLGKFPMLLYLYLGSTHISDLSPIMRMEGLRELNITHTKQHKHAVQRLNKKFPD